MRLGASRANVRAAAALALVLACAALPLRSAAAINVAAPREGAVLPSAQVIVAGTEDRLRSGTVEVTLNGQAQPSADLRDGVFSFPLTLRSGKNRLSLRAGSSARDFVYEVRDGAAYRFHPGFLEGECGECHAGGAGTPAPEGQSELCHSCHDRKDGERYLHGPVGAGQCTFCHDPHGSGEPAFLTVPGTDLCGGCHDQPSSTSHMESSRGRVCTECHNPHGSGKKFFLY